MVVVDVGAAAFAAAGFAAVVVVGAAGVATAAGTAALVCPNLAWPLLKPGLRFGLNSCPHSYQYLLILICRMLPNHMRVLKQQNLDCMNIRWRNSGNYI